MKRTKSIIAAICRTLLGLVFIFSGAVKAIDPLGTVYKIEDYLKAFGGFFTDLLPAAQTAAWCLIILELLLGVCMLMNVRTRCTAWITLLFYAVMTPLTLYIAFKNPVSDCGCFGDAIVLTNWQTFYKNLVLILLAILLVCLRKSTRPLWTGWMELIIVACTISATISFMGWTTLHLPCLDFRPYKIGNHLPTIMEDYQDDQYEYTFICMKDGVEQAFTAANYPDSTWTLVRHESKLIKKGYESPIHDFEIINAYGDDITWDILESEEPITLVIMYDLQKANKEQMAKVEALYNYTMLSYTAIDAPITADTTQYDTILADTMLCDETLYDSTPLQLAPFYILTGSNTDEIIAFNQEYPSLSDCICYCDPVTLKTIVRANPGGIVLQNGTVIDKYNVRNR